MVFEFNFYSSLLLIFFFHGLVYALLCFKKGYDTQSRSYSWLGVYLLLSILFIAPWMVGFAGWYDNQPYRDILLYTPTKFTWALGPIMFIYVQSLLNPSYRFKGKQWWHLAPLGLYLLVHAFIFLHDKVWHSEPLILAKGIDPDFSDFADVPGLLSMIVYFLLALRYYRLYRKLMVHVVSYADAVTFRWVRNFLLAFLVFIIVTALFAVVGLFYPLYYSGNWWYYLVFACIFYYIAITGYSNAIEATVAFRPNLLQYRPALLLPAAHSTIAPNGATADSDALVEDIDYIDLEKPSAGGLPPGFELDAWKQKLTRALLQDKGYQQPELTLLSLARQLGTNPSILSKVVNQGFGQNFNDLVNGYRIAAFQQLARQGLHRQQTLLAMAYEVGFNSKATFNRAFLKHAGVGPREWLKQEGLN